MEGQLILNSLKGLFSSLGAKTADSNYAVGLFDKTSAEPKGIMGMSDLASVLGVNKFLMNKLETVTDPNNISVSGWCYVTSPDNGCLLSLFLNENPINPYYHHYCYQLLFVENINGNVIKYRHKESSTWTSWREL